MQPVNAVVKNGRLTLDVPSSLPDGQIVPLLPLEELLAAADALDEDAPLSFEVVRAPRPAPPRRRGVDAAALIDELRAL